MRGNYATNRERRAKQAQKRTDATKKNPTPSHGSNGVGYCHAGQNFGGLLLSSHAYGFMACCNALQSIPEIFPSVVSVQSGVSNW